ncbi:Macrophage colony-stimulating factor 1 receptor [Cryptotrichosporon argae]
MAGDPVNWLFLAELVVCIIVASAFLFYWNRLFGSVVAFFVRLVSWRLFNAYIHIGSLQISPLAGRIAFRDVEYHSSNVSVRALTGTVTFRYWKVRVRHEHERDARDTSEPAGGASASASRRRAKLPCRVVLVADGVEAFFYNRTPAYDAIVERMKKHERETGKGATDTDGAGEDGNGNEAKKGARLRRARPMTRDSSNSQQSSDHGYPPKPLGNNPVGAGTDLPYQPKPVMPPVEVSGIDWFREALPLELRVSTGSVVLGSDATPMVVISDFKTAKGTLEMSASRSKCDKYKLSANLAFTDVSVLMRTNVDYSGPLLAHGKKAYDELLRRQPDLAQQPPSVISLAAGFRFLARRFPFLRDPKFSTPPVTGLQPDRVWKGLARYRLANTTKRPHREEREYAKVTTLLTTRAVEFTYYADTPGLVPLPSDAAVIDPSDELGNVEPSPEYGIDLVLHGGAVNYGPWADRQRDALQKAFAPSIFFDSEPRPRLNPGDTRLHAALVLNVSMTERTTLRIPTREASKDWLYDGKGEVERRYGWLDVAVGANSSVVYTQSQFATAHGYDAMLVLHLDSLDLASSVNLQTFLTAKACRLTMTMPTPLQWDAQRDWGLDINLDTPDVNLLRDHVTLISDVAKDWSSGALGDFHHFVPNHYNFRISFINYAFHLFINDFNIVDVPQSREENAFVDIRGPRMDAYVAVASTRYRPEFSVIPFSVEGHDAHVDLALPKWDTHHAFSSGAALEVGKIGTVKASGSYRYYSVPKPDHQETLQLHLEASRVVFIALGWAVRRMFAIKDNYFGGFTQYSTMQEYLERFDHDPNSVGDPVEEKFRPNRSDPFAVKVTMDVTHSLILASDEIYDHQSGTAMPVPRLQMVLSTNEYAMELALDSPPTFIAPAPELQRCYDTVTVPLGHDAVYIEGIDLKASRLFGPQPQGTTYFCLWELSIPRLSAFVSPAFSTAFLSVIRALIYNFDDVENAPSSIYQQKTPPDATFFKMSLGPTSALLSAGDSGVAIQAPAVSLDTSNIATRSFGSNLGLAVARVTVNAVARRTGKWALVGRASSGIAVDSYRAPRGWRQKASAQQAFLREQDAPTKRVAYLYGEDVSGLGQHIYEVYLPHPLKPEQWSDDESADEDDIEPDNASSSSGGGTAPRPVRRRHSRSVATAYESASSAGDESDSTDSAGSDSSAEAAVPFSAAAKLHHRMRVFATLGPAEEGEADRGDDDDDVEFGDSPLKGHATLDHGGLVRMSVRHVKVDLSPETLAVLAPLVRAFSEDSQKPSIILDKLLKDHTAAVLEDNSHRGGLIMDIQVPVVDIRLASGSTDVVCRTCDIGGRLTKRPLLDPTKSSTDFAVLARSVEIIASGQPAKLSLADVLDLDTLDNRALASVSARNLGLALHSQPDDQSIRVKLSSADVDAVTAAVQTVSKFAVAWTNAVSAFDTPASVPSARVLHAMLRGAIERDLVAAQPGFMYEGAYGLHLNDQRNIRRDVGWLTLSRFRHWLCALPALPPPPLAPPRSVSDDRRELGKYVLDELCKLEDLTGGDEAFFARQQFVKQAFGDLFDAEPEDMARCRAAFGSIGTIRLAHHCLLLDSATRASSAATLSTASFGLQEHARPQATSHVRALIAVQAVDVDVQDSIFALAKVAAAAMPPTRPATVAAQPILPTPRVILLDAQVGSATVAVTAGLPKCTAVVRGGHATAAIRTGGASPSDVAAGSAERNFATVSVDGAELALADSTDSRVLVFLGIDGVHGVVNQVRNADEHSRVALAVKVIRVGSKPQLKVLLDLGRDWYEHRYSMYKKAIAACVPPARPTPIADPAHTDARPVPSCTGHNEVDLQIGSVRMQVRATKSLWFGWDTGKLYVTQQGSARDLRFGLRMDPQVIGAYTSSKRTAGKDSSKIRLPDMTAIGRYRRPKESTACVNVQLNLGMFTGVLKPALLERLLSLRQRLGDDIAVLADECREVRNQTTPEPKHTATTAVLFELSGTVAGIRVGLRADNVPTTLLFEALQLECSASNAQSSVEWRAKASHVGLSLCQLNEASLTQAQPVRRARSAYMVVDVDAHEAPATALVPAKLTVALSRVHTVMHVAALSELADLIRAWAADISTLHTARADEVNEVRQQTTRVLKKLDPAERGEAHTSWFASRWFTLDVTGFGIAIPLDASMDVGKDAPGPALLYSIRVMNFGNRRNETARLKIQHMMLQIIDKFDQNANEHFAGDFHSTSNRMSLPGVDSRAQMSSETDTWTLAAHCSATDFKLSVTPDIADAVFKLVDMYEQGKTHLVQMSQEYHTEWARRDPAEHSAISPTSAQPLQRIVVRMSFTFNSGIVEFHREVEHKAASRRKTDWHDTFTLPTVSVWMDYQGAEHGPATLLFNAAVHESHNVLRPSILPFFVQLVHKLETRAKRKVSSIYVPLDHKVERIADPVAETAVAMADAPSKLRIRATLRIDRSELRFSCAPDSNAYVDLKWEAGGFMVSTLIGGTETTTLAGTASGITAYLSHEFAAQGRGCIEAGAKDMAFSLALCPLDGTSTDRGLSVVLDSQVSAQFRLEAFSAWLIFISVWVDNAPKLDIPLRTGVADAAATPQLTTQHSELAVAALVRFRNIDFDASLGVTRAHLHMAPIVLRTLSNGECTEVDLNIGVSQVTARGDISGDMRSESLTFNTVRRSARATADTSPTVLRMSIAGGDLYSNLFIGDTNIVRFQLDPAKVTLVDDWTEHATDASASVSLAFVVEAGQFHSVLRLPAIPRLLGHLYSIIDMVDSQNKIAVQRSDMVKARREREALHGTAPAVVLLSSPRTDGHAVKTAQTMRFDLAGIDVGVFADDYEDGTLAEFYRFVVGKVEADLKRKLTLTELSERDLGLRVEAVKWEISDGRKAVRAERRDISAADLITKAMRHGHKVVGYLPSMNLTMASVEYPDPATVDFDFDLVWGKTDGDIAIMPNFFEAAYRSFQKLAHGVEAQQLARSRRLGVQPSHARSPARGRKNKSDADSADDGCARRPLVFRRRGVAPATIPVPKLKMLGEATGDAAMLVPKFQQGVKELPSLSHNFVTLPLEDGMDLLLKLYEKQLPN